MIVATAGPVAVVVDSCCSVVHHLSHFLLLVRPEADDERQFVQCADSSQHGTLLSIPRVCVRVSVKPTEKQMKRHNVGTRKIWILVGERRRKGGKKGEHDF